MCAQVRALSCSSLCSDLCTHATVPSKLSVQDVCIAKPISCFVIAYVRQHLICAAGSGGVELQTVVKVHSWHVQLAVHSFQPSFHCLYLYGWSDSIQMDLSTTGDRATSTDLLCSSGEQACTPCQVDVGLVVLASLVMSALLTKADT